MFAWNAFILTKRTITSCSVMEKFRKVNFPSHDGVWDVRIRYLNHLRSLIVLSTKVNNLPFWKFEFSHERRCHGSVNMTVSKRWVWFRLEWLTRKCYGLGWNLSWWSHSAQNCSRNIECRKIQRRHSWSYRSALSATTKLWSRLSTWQCKMSRGSCLSRLSEAESHPCSSFPGIITGSVTNWTFIGLTR